MGNPKFAELNEKMLTMISGHEKVVLAALKDRSVMWRMGFLNGLRLGQECKTLSPEHDEGRVEGVKLFQEIPNLIPEKTSPEDLNRVALYIITLN